MGTRKNGHARRRHLLVSPSRALFLSFAHKRLRRLCKLWQPPLQNSTILIKNFRRLLRVIFTPLVESNKFVDLIRLIIFHLFVYCFFSSQYRAIILPCSLLNEGNVQQCCAFRFLWFSYGETMIAFESLSQTIHTQKNFLWFCFRLLLILFSPHKSLFEIALTPLSALRCPQASPFTKPETTPPLRVKILTFHCKYSFYLWKRMHCSGSAFTKW